MDSRNDDSQAQMRALMAMLGPPNPAYIRARRAWERCEICGRCGRSIAAGEPVRVTRICAGDSSATAPTCAACRPSWESDFQFRPPQPCDGCGRMVSVRPRAIIRKVVVCSERCGWTARNRLRAKRGTWMRRRCCSVCGTEFVATRVDAKTCSNACRQRAYRQRSAAG